MNWLKYQKIRKVQYQVGGKVVNYYYREVVKEDVVKKQAPVVVNYYKEGTLIS